ncbi:MAG TPA: methyltransferase domain-containing protein [Xanthobacteraceae bacterium]|nr:methyltransferase domain-containing protein [Xanthobacteraceae bacterium]
MSNHPIIFDRALLKDRQRRAASLGAATFLIDRVADDMRDRLAAVLREFKLAADIGTPTDAVVAALADGGSVGTMIAMRPYAPEKQVAATVVADEEALPFAAQSLDLAVSALALQSVNDLPGVLIQIRRALKPDGLFLAAMLGGETLTELRESMFAAEAEQEGGASPRVAPFTEVRAAGTLLQRAGFALPVTDVDRVTVRYASPVELMNDLRRMGATNPLAERQRRPMRRATLQRALEIYAERFSGPDGRVRATFDILWLSGWAPHESQQQPLRPGSARTRLADVLGTRELPAGEKAGH